MAVKKEKKTETPAAGKKKGAVKKAASGGEAQPAASPEGSGGEAQPAASTANTKKEPAKKAKKSKAKKAPKERKILVIVESPAKAKTIEKYLGPSYTVKASMGHLIDLPKSRLAIDVDHDFTPEYITMGLPHFSHT
ncbi:hypothetical protein AGMMS49546_38510 [Spirochaetia bacterium]|nr:hypothetical protein AGMMS49546_38510 [Spirochaetia bacterium]